MRRWLRILRWTGIATAITAGAAGLLLLLAYGFLQSESGRARMVEILNWQLSTPGVSEIRIGRLEGNLLDRIEIHELSVSDSDGTWLRLKFAGASWRPAILLAGTLSISNLDIGGLTVLRQPRQTESTGEFNWPELPFGIAIENFLLSDAILEHPVLGEEVIFKASGNTEIEGSDRVRTTIEITRTDGVSSVARLQATLQPRSQFLRFELTLDEDRGGVLVRALDLKDLPSLSIQASGEGPLDQLQGTARVATEDLGFIESSFIIAAGDQPALKLKGHAQIARLVDEPLPQLLASDVAFDLHAVLQDDGFLLQRGLFANDLTRIDLSGELSNYAADFKLTMAVDDLAPLSDIAGIALRGQLSLQSRIQSDDIRRRASASTRAILSEVLPAASPLLTLVGSQVKVAGKLEFDVERAWQFRDLTVNGDAIELTTSGSISNDSGKLALDYQLSLPRLAALTDIVGSSLNGNLTIMGNIGGSLSDPTLVAHMLSPLLSIDGITLGATEARVNILQFSNLISGDVELSIANQHYGAVNLASKFATNANDSLRFDGLMVESRNTRLAGALAIDFPSASVTGKISGEKIDLAPWSELAGRALSGIANLSLDLNHNGKIQVLDLALIADGLNLEMTPEESLQVDNVNASARIKDLFGTPRGGMRLLATDARFSDARFTSIALETRMDSPQRLQGRLQTQGELHGPFELEMSADYSARDRGFVLIVSEAEASISGQIIKLSKPLQLEHDNGTTLLSKSRLSIADGSLTANGEVGSDHIKMRLQAEGISIAALHNLIPTANLTGTLSGLALVSGSRVAPIGELDLRIVDVSSAHSKLNRAAPVSGQLRGEWRDGRLLLTANFTGATETGIEAHVSIPLQLEQETLALAMPTNEAIDGKLNWSGELGPLWDLFSPYEDRFSGPGEIALALAGSLDNPAISGYFQLLGGHYENLQSATTLVNLNLRLAGDGDKLVLERLTAADGETGSLVGSGSIDFIPAQSYPIHLRLEFSDMRLVARDDVTLNASGNLTLEGSLSNTLLSGEIITGQSELSLAGTLPPSVVELEVDEINVASAKQARQAPAPGTADPSTMVLELKITVPGRAFVRGLGLESEWKGDIKINGPTNAPKLSGVLSPVRGRFFLMGKSFRLEHGAIRFTDSDEIDPLLDLTAEHKAAGLTALVRVTGSASKPEILLTSRPPLPESEIASQVLFGTNSSNLTTAQSLQLASAIATYSGTSGAIGILDATRRALGVDVINFSESAENPNKTRVGVGKYLSEGVYIEIEGGGEESSRTSTTVEVEVLPNVRVEGGTTETGANKVGVKWKWDY